MRSWLRGRSRVDADGDGDAGMMCIMAACVYIHGSFSCIDFAA